MHEFIVLQGMFILFFHVIKNDKVYLAAVVVLYSKVTSFIFQIWTKIKSVFGYTKAKFSLASTVS